MRTIIHYGWLTARRDRILWLLGGMMAAIWGAGISLGGTALVEQPETALALIAGSLRLLLAFGAMVFVVQHIDRMKQGRELMVMLSRPLRRSHWIIAYGLFLLQLSAALVVMASLLLAMAGAAQGLGLWALTLWGELVLVMLAAMAFSLMLEASVAAIMASGSFYLLGRIMVYMIMTQDSVFGRINPWIDPITHGSMRIISHLMPRLDMMAQSRWLLYGTESMEGYGWWVALQLIGFSALLLVMAMVDFRRKEY
jgi:ABC-type transport system involved in multi-copper enzyme maturation permease subunit